MTDTLWLRFGGDKTRRLFSPLSAYWRHQPITVAAIKWYVIMSPTILHILSNSWKCKPKFVKFVGHFSVISTLFLVYSDCLVYGFLHYYYSFEIFFSQSVEHRCWRKLFLWSEKVIHDSLDNRGIPPFSKRCALLLRLCRQEIQLFCS